MDESISALRATEAMTACVSPKRAEDTQLETNIPVYIARSARTRWDASSLIEYSPWDRKLPGVMPSLETSAMLEVDHVTHIVGDLSVTR